MFRRCWPILIGLFWFGCGGDETQPIVSRWKYQTASPAAPPGLGPERRVLIARQSQGELVTVNEENGLKVEGPFPVFPTEHAPVAVGATLVLVSTIGKVVGYNLAGSTLFTQPAMDMLLETSPLVKAADGSLRIATTSGRVLGLPSAEGATLFDATIDGAVTTSPSVGADGTTYVATDTGRLYGVSSSGAIVLNVQVAAPASGPSIDDASGHVAVGEADAVRVVDRDGRDVFKHSRAARVVGTRWISSDELLAWGEDGIVERLDGSGGVISTFNAGHPIYADVVPLASGSIAVFDSTGIAHRVKASGESDGIITLGTAPLPQIVRGELGWLFAAIGNEVWALDFELDE